MNPNTSTDTQNTMGKGEVGERVCTTGFGIVGCHDWFWSCSSGTSEENYNEVADSAKLRFFCMQFLLPFLLHFFWRGWLDDVVWVCPLLASLRLRNVKPVVVSSGPQMGEKWSQGCWPPWNCYRTSKLVVGRWISFWDGLVSGAM